MALADRILALDPEKAVSYAVQAAETKALAIPNDGVAFFPPSHFPLSGSADLLEFYVFVKETSHRVSLCSLFILVLFFCLQFATVKLRFIGLVTQGHRSFGLEEGARRARRR